MSLEEVTGKNLLICISWPLDRDEWARIEKDRLAYPARTMAREDFPKWPESVRKYVESGRLMEKTILPDIRRAKRDYTLHPLFRLKDRLDYWLSCELRDAEMTDEEWDWNPETCGNRADYSVLPWLQRADGLVKEAIQKGVGRRYALIRKDSKPVDEVACKYVCEAIAILVDMNTNHPCAPPIDAFDFETDEWRDMRVREISAAEERLIEAIFGVDDKEVDDAG